MIINVEDELSYDFMVAEEIRQGNLSRLCRIFDATALKQTLTKDAVTKLCSDSIQNNFRAVCIPPSYAAVASGLLNFQEHNRVFLCSVIGFPLGYATTNVKVFEMKDAVARGVRELDVVQNVGWVKDGNWKEIEREYCELMSHSQGRLVKLILETAELTDDEIYQCTVRAVRAGFHIIKTSTGFSTRGASVQDINTITRAIQDDARENGRRMIGVKASGGIKTLQQTLELVRAGATRIGTSSAVQILAEVGRSS